MSGGTFNKMKLDISLVFMLLLFARGLAASSLEQSEPLKTFGWRMDGTGCYPNANPPTEWSTTKNVLWSTPLPNKSSASPVLMNGLLFCCSDPNSILCIDATTGKILWEKTNALEDVATPDQLAKMQQSKIEAQQLYNEQIKLRGELDELKKTLNDADCKKKWEESQVKLTAIYAKLKLLKPFLQPEGYWYGGNTGSTPVTNGVYVYAVFPTGVVVCYDTRGNRVWIRFIETPIMHHGHTSSPILAGDKLLIQLNELTAFDAATGQTQWTADVASTHGTPIEVKIGDTPALLTPYGNLVRIGDGRVLASTEARTTFCASPIVHNGIAYFVRDTGHIAIKLPGTTADTVRPEVVWKAKAPVVDENLTNELNTGPHDFGTVLYWASPVFHDGVIYAITLFGTFSAIDAGTGSVACEKTLADFKSSGEFYPNLVFAGKHLFVSGKNGMTLVIDPGNKYKEIARNTLEPFIATPIFDGKRIYVRGEKTMYCIGEE